MPRLRVAGLVLVGAAVLSAERWTRATRATRAERRRELPGDDLVRDPIWSATRATTIRAPRQRVWPWLVQMGFPTHRAGWYTPFLIDRLLFGIRARSAREVIPALQGLSVGDVVPDSDSGVSFFTVARLDAPSALVLRSHTHPLPVYRDVDFSWAFVLEDRPDGTRLLMRARVRFTPVEPAALVRALVVTAFGVGDVLQAGGMLNGVRRRVEGGSPTG